MEEIQSWWEVPAVAHFCYVFRSAFNLIFFEIAELESALLNIQDPDMSISLDQLIIRLLQGCFDDESINEESWEEKLHELFNENCQDDQNPFDNSQYFFQLTPRSKIEILFKLCEFRLDAEGTLEAIKNIPSEDMQAKCMGKDNQNNTYWYFCDERLYKEDSSWKKANQNQKKKEVKNTVNKNNKPVKTREKRTKVNADINKSWTVECFNVSDWEKLLKTFSKSKNTQEKELVKEIKTHLPVLQERVSEKDRLLRKRFMELAPKRTSSRISRVQEKKKLEEIKAQEEARLAKLEAEKEQARKEALKLKEEKESRQKRAETRHKAIEERAKRAKLREMARDTQSEDSDSDSDQDYNAHEENQNQKIVSSYTRRNLQAIAEQSDESEDSNSEDSDNDSDSDYEASSYHQRTSTRKMKKYTSTSLKSAQHDKNKRCVRTYSNYKEQSRNNQIRSSSRLQSNSKTVKYRFDTESEQSDSDEAPMETDENEVSTRLRQNRLKPKDESDSDESDGENESDSDESNSDDTERDKTCNNVKAEDSISVQNNSNTSANNSDKSQGSSLNLPRVTVYKTTLLKDSSDMAKWNAVLDSKGQKLHILNGSCDNLSPKKLKLEQGKIFRTSSPILKSSLSKENHIYQPVRQTPFITYGKIIPSSPSIVRLDFRKPPNHQVSS